MTLNYVTLVLDAYDAQGNLVTKGSASFVPSAQLTDPGVEWIPPAPVPAVFHAAGPPSVKLLATDNTAPQPEGWGWTVTFSGVPGDPAGFSFFLPYTGGSTQYLSALAPVGSVVPAGGGTVTGSVVVTGDLSANGFQLPVLPPSARPVPWRTASSFSQQFQTGHGWTSGGSGLGSSNLNDTSTFCRGTQCATLVTAGNGGQANLLKLSGTVPDLTGKAVRIIIKADDIAHLQTGAVNFYVGTNGLGKTFKWRLNLADTESALVTSGDWVILTASWANCDSASGAGFSLTGGVPSQTSGFTDMQVQVLDDAAGTVTCHIQAVEVITDTPATFPSGVVSLVFDDSYQSVYDLARPVLDAAGYRGTLYTIAGNIGTSTYLTLDELNVLQDQSGWEVAGHAYTSAAHAARYPNLTAAQVDDDARNMRSWLVTNGFRGDSFAYPGGNFEKTTDGVEVDAIVQRYFSSARTILSTISAGTNYGNSEMWPPPMPWRLRAIQPVTSDITGSPNVTNLLATGSTLDKCAANGGWVFLVFHEVVSGSPTDTLQIQQSDLQSLVTGIANRGMTVLPAGDVLRYYS